MIRVVVFDLGGVLVDFAGFRELPKLLRDALPVEEVRRRWIASPSVAAFERGGMSAEDFGAAFLREWDLSIGAEEFVTAFIAWAGAFLPGARDLLDALRARIPIACFSNTNEIHWQRNFREHGILRAFDHTFASFELGWVKPEPQAFAAVIEELGQVLSVTPGEILFLDDTEVNVEAARAAGLSAEHVRGVTAARSVLIEKLPAEIAAVLRQ